MTPQEAAIRAALTDEQLREALAAAGPYSLLTGEYDARRADLEAMRDVLVAALAATAPPKRKYRGRSPEPDVQIRCDCGSTWRGRATVDNPVIAAHRLRGIRGRQMGCFVHPPTPRTDAAYRRLHPLPVPPSPKEER